jgi:hypothetical protein
VNARRNPVLDLPSAKRLEELPIEARIALRAVLLDLADEANDQAEDAWSRKKGPMAAYWRAVSTYAKHIARATLRSSEVPVREPINAYQPFLSREVPTYPGNDGYGFLGDGVDGRAGDPDDFDERGTGPDRYPTILRDQAGRPVDVG